MPLVVALPACGVSAGRNLPDAARPAGDAAMQTCTPGDPPVCDGDTLKTCSPDGILQVSSCPAGCMNGACVCAVGQRQCSGMVAQACGSDGAWHDDTTCLAGTVCRDGVCDDVRCPDEMMGGGEFSLPNDAWPRFRHDNRNTGWNAVVVADQPKLAWKAGPYGTAVLNPQGAGMSSGPVISQKNVVFVGGGDGDGQNGAYYALDVNGKLLWTFQGNRGWGYTTPAVRSDGTSYFSSQDANAYAVSDMGMLVWKFAFGMQDDCSPIVTSAGNVIYGSDTHQLFAMDFNGKSLWTSDTTSGPGEVDGALGQTCDGVVLAGGTSGWAALDAKTGMTLWRVPASGSQGALMSAPLVAFDGTMYGVDLEGVGIAIDATGKIVWQQQLGPAGAATSMAKVGDQLFVVLDDGMLHALDAATGNSKWAVDVGNQTETYKHGGPVVDGRQRLYFNSNDGNLYCFDITGKPLWKQPTSGISTPGGNSYGEMAIGNDGALYVPGNDGMLYVFR